MISADDLTRLIRKTIDDAEVTVYDRTGTQDHLMVHVVSDVFKTMKLMDRHRLVQKSVDEAMKDGRIHALEIKTEVRS